MLCIILASSLVFVLSVHLYFERDLPAQYHSDDKGEMAIIGLMKEFLPETETIAMYLERFQLYCKVNGIMLAKQVLHDWKQALRSTL